MIKIMPKKKQKKTIIFYNLHKRSMRPTQASGVMTTVFTTHNPSTASDNNSNTAYVGDTFTCYNIYRVHWTWHTHLHKANWTFNTWNEEVLLEQTVFCWMSVYSSIIRSIKVKKKKNLQLILLYTYFTHILYTTFCNI